jgi:hypothetical protein
LLVCPPLTSLALQTIPVGGTTKDEFGIPFPQAAKNGPTIGAPASGLTPKRLMNVELFCVD